MGFTKEIALSLAAVAVCACTVSGTPAGYRDTSRHVNPATGTICNGASLALRGTPSARDVFEHPPQEARVQMWYHWIGDCITEEGLVRDFRAMGEAGVGTAHVFAPSMAALPVKAKPLDAEWMRLFAVAIREARKNGMTLGFHNCPGWSSSGGPWILPENSMKMVVSSVADVPVPAGPVFLPQPQTNENYYRDIAAYALPVPIAAPPVSSPFPLLCADEEGCRESSGKMVYEKPFSPRFFSFKSAGGRFVARVRIEAFAEGVWRKIGEREWGPWVNIPGVRTLRLECPVPSRRFRVTCSHVDSPAWMGKITSVIGDGTLETAPMLGDVALCNCATSVVHPLTVRDPAEKGVDPGRIFDVSRFLAADGSFDAVAAQSADSLPRCGPGEICRIVRIGFTSTGKGPAPATIRGLECDKLSRRGIDAHWAAMPAKILSLPGAKETVRYCIIDSYEVGGQNWTEDLPREFAARRGYEIDRNLLCVCGYCVGTVGASRDFLQDWQRTIAELFAENYYDRFSELCHEAGVESILEPYGGPFEALRCGRSADVPTGEFWLGGGTCGGSPRIAASLGHLNGRVRIAAESFTTNNKEGRWQLTPHQLRTVGDASGWLQGINQIVVHSYLHQPFPNARPGLSLGPHGSQINVNTTWWPEMREWTDYVRRGQALLQYGKPQADVLILGGVEQPELFALGMNFDCCSQADILRLRPAPGGGVAMPGGLPYRALVVETERARLHPETRLALDALAKAGCRIATGSSVAAVRKLHLRSFFEAPNALRAVHREGPDGSRIWFVVNVREEPFRGVADFAAPEGTTPGIFDAVTGQVRAVPNAIGDAPDRIKVSLELPAKGSAFVVFSGEPKRTSMDAPKEPLESASPRADMKVADLSSGWTIVAFDGVAAPKAPLGLAKLESWSKSPDARLRYFAGRAVYEKRVECSELAIDDGMRMILDLGEVHEIARVWVNDIYLGCLWEPPYRIELPSFILQSPVLNLRIEVVNTWPNRLIGDAKVRAEGAAEPLGERGVPKWVLDGRTDSGTGISTWSNFREAWRADEPLLPSGLLGPVALNVRNKE